jgi:5-methylcytosine-specific restriction enzyme subunit McrC
MEAAAALPAEQPARAPAKHPIVYRVREYDPVDVPLSDLLNAKGRLRLNPDVESKGYFTVQLTSLLRVSGYVPSSLGAERPYAADPAWNESLVDLFAGWLAAPVDIIASEGLLLLYEQREEATSFPRGRVLAGATLTQLRPRGIRHQAVSSWFARSADSPANRCLKYAIWFIAGRLAILGSRTASRRRLLQRLGALYELFSSVPLEHSLSFLGDPLVTGARATPSLRHYYRPALDLAMAIVRRYAVDVEVTRRGVDLPSMVLDMDSIFESYLRNTLQAEAGRAGGGVDVLDGNAVGKKPLFDDPPSENATPDIVFSRGGHRWPLVIEVKNVPVKGNSSRGAIEQAVTYAAAYRCNRVVLAHPRARNQDEAGLRLQGRIGDLAVYQYVFDLEAADLLAEESKFADSMFDLCSTDSS